jgi:hypothetical protein
MQLNYLDSKKATHGSVHILFPFLFGVILALLISFDQCVNNSKYNLIVMFIIEFCGNYRYWISVVTVVSLLHFRLVLIMFSGK